MGSLSSFDGVELTTRTWAIDDPRYDVLIVHGLGEHSGRWDEPARLLNRHGATVYSFDLRGHGLSGGDRMYFDDYEQLHGDIATVARESAASSGRPWVLYGHSLGGLQCAGYLIDEHDPMPNIAVLSAPPMVRTRPTDRVFSGASKVLGSVTPKLRINTAIKGSQLSRDPAVGEAYFEDPLVQTTATVGLGVATFAEQDRLAGLHDKILTPTYLFHGAEDPLVEPAASACLAASPGVQRTLLPGLRHETHNEPEGAEVIGAVTDWIESQLF